LDDRLARSVGARVANLSGIGAVVHQQQVEIPNVVDQKGLEVIWAQVFRSLVRSITNFHHRPVSFESAAHARINTLWLSPLVLENKITFTEKKKRNN
jgi:hypothetical protein